MRKVFKMWTVVIFLITFHLNTYASSFDAVWKNTKRFEGNSINEAELSKHGIMFYTVHYYNETYNSSFNLKELTESQAKEIARVMYWEEYKINEIKNQKIASNLFDYAFNAGPSEAIKVLRLVVNDRISLERKKGNKTLSYLPIISRVDSQLLLYIERYGESLVWSYKSARLEKYKKKTKWNLYKSGWLYRINNI